MPLKMQMIKAPNILKLCQSFCSRMHSYFAGSGVKQTQRGRYGNCTQPQWHIPLRPLCVNIPCCNQSTCDAFTWPSRSLAHDEHSGNLDTVLSTMIQQHNIAPTATCYEALLKYCASKGEWKRVRIPMKRLNHFYDRA
eukprot:GHVN01054595.1.p1 GENE.GHVN01054595.1~~GHVN01054595.1.p1  ORF type:complete len:157 (+),score=5.53 GHVN01054595.1:59-472(+)